MSLYYDTGVSQDPGISQDPGLPQAPGISQDTGTCQAVATCQDFETIQPVALGGFRIDDAPQLTPIRAEPRNARDETCSKYLRSGARIISSDERSKTVLCTHQGEWSVWLLDEEGEPIRGAYFNSMRAAAFDYAEHVMGCHTVEWGVEFSDIEE